MKPKAPFSGVLGRLVCEIGRKVKMYENQTIYCVFSTYSKVREMILGPLGSKRVLREFTEALLRKIVRTCAQKAARGSPRHLPAHPPYATL